MSINGVAATLNGNTFSVTIQPPAHGGPFALRVSATTQSGASFNAPLFYLEGYRILEKRYNDLGDYLWAFIYPYSPISKDTNWSLYAYEWRPGVERCPQSRADAPIGSPAFPVYWNFDWTYDVKGSDNENPDPPAQPSTAFMAFGEMRGYDKVTDYYDGAITEIFLGSSLSAWTGSRLKIRIPQYPENTPIIFTFTGLTYSAPDGTELDFTKVLFQGKEPISIADNGDGTANVGYPLVVSGGQELAITQDSFTWPESNEPPTTTADMSGWPAWASRTTSYEFHHLLSFDEFFNEQIVCDLDFVNSLLSANAPDAVMDEKLEDDPGKGLFQEQGTFYLKAYSSVKPGDNALGGYGLSLEIPAACIDGEGLSPKPLFSIEGRSADDNSNYSELTPKQDTTGTWYVDLELQETILAVHIKYPFARYYKNKSFDFMLRLFPWQVQNSEVTDSVSATNFTLPIELSNTAFGFDDFSCPKHEDDPYHPGLYHFTVKNESQFTLNYSLVPESEKALENVTMAHSDCISLAPAQLANTAGTISVTGTSVGNTDLNANYQDPYPTTPLITDILEPRATVYSWEEGSPAKVIVFRVYDPRWTDTAWVATHRTACYPEGNCPTTAYIQPASVDNQGLSDYLNNTVYNQAVFHLDLDAVVDLAVEYDLNGNGLIDNGPSLYQTSPGVEHAPIKSAIDAYCAAHSIPLRHAILVFTSAGTSGAGGHAGADDKYSWVLNDSIRTAAHELGHTLFSLGDLYTLADPESSDYSPSAYQEIFPFREYQSSSEITYDERDRKNLYEKYGGDRLRQFQWIEINIARGGF